ncbi:MULTISPECIES: carboxylesterase/lipase family protein [unclassified Pseudomonas]|uniref:carboxylesterase/lipase family protein n=1 Tax=unclassified Pseudomonas TaxID=196821 RepID=UPI000A1E3A00|nr:MULTISPECIES: carboxylesterase family protein [unclassified Pseudomonas]
MKVPFWVAPVLLGSWLPLLATAATGKPPFPEQVRVDTGLLQGVAKQEVLSFKGIPYATPPIGELRWRAPQPPKAWDGVRSADAFGPECMQVDKVAMSEDCLTLNIWRPAAASTQPLPVMVWIYGGVLVHGATSLYPADALAAQGVIVVSMNYRMGRLGFFAHPAQEKDAPDEVHGNYGFLDQQAALQWVQRNIAAFGGDPGQVTLFGESAGGGSVLVHLTSPLSKGLFQRAILQSPGIPTASMTALPLTSLEQARQRALDYARSQGIHGDGAQALAALRKLPAEKLVQGTSASEVMAGLSRGVPVSGVAGAILDGRMIIESPEQALAAGHQAKMPVLVGANSRDLGIGDAKSKDELFARFGEASDEARRLYDPSGEQALEELKSDVLADETLIEPARHLADEVARSGQPVWLYRFGYVAEVLRGKQKGTLHALEIPYTFDLPAALVGKGVTADDKAMGRLASAYWTAFGKSGDPNGAGRLQWPRHDPAIDRLMHFTNEGPVVGTDPLKPRLDLVAGQRAHQ